MRTEIIRPNKISDIIFSGFKKEIENGYCFFNLE
jgi:hypothetical protein